MLYIYVKKDYDEENVEEKSSRLKTPQRGLPGNPVVEAVWRGACEDRLRVALIQPGSIRYQPMKGQLRSFQGAATRVEPRSKS